MLNLHYNIDSRATQSNSVYVSVLQISTVLADGVSKSLCQNFFSRERPLSARGKILYFATMMDTEGVYYSLAVWRFEAILSAGLRFYSHLSDGLRLKNSRAVAGNHKFSSRFSVFTCFCGGYSNRVKRHRRLSGNFILLKASLFNKGLPFRARPNQSGLPSVLKDRLRG